ncbi:MAG TPA: helix-turn-helix domain-containing protein [Pseudomonas sp.]|uniref:helix-turn-helix domain-containing protein n=1 Tax=Pseudomonas sp. TaxID=306 RepID=UPI002ED958E0
MEAWKVSTENCPIVERAKIWQRAMDKLYMPGCTYSDGADRFRGNVYCVSTPQGVEFARVFGTPLEIAGKSADQPYTIWLALVIEGVFSLRYKGLNLPAREGDIIYAPTGLDMSLTAESDFKMLYVKIPPDLVHSRVLNPTLIDVGYLSCETGVNRIFANMLQSVSENIESIDPSTLRPVEIALAEFLVMNLIQQGRVQDFGGTAKMLHFKRICQGIDVHLADPDLSLGRVASEHHVSPRYVQKLFEASGSSFVSYVRVRRLERCRCELGNPEYRHLSVSDICFRWGFNDAAHFSRVFRNTFGVAPREYRRQKSELASA